MNENYGDDLRREMQKLRVEMGISPEKSGRSVKKPRASWRVEKASKNVPPRVSEPKALVVDTPATPTVDDTKVAVNPTSDIRVESVSPAAGPKFSTPKPVNPKAIPTKLGRGALISAGVLIVAASTYGYVRFDFVTATQGIDTTLGESANRAIVIDTFADVARTDLVAAKLPYPKDDGSDAILIGTVFSDNTETVAVYDGEVIWQIPVGDVLGTVMFATATEAL